MKTDHQIIDEVNDIARRTLRIIGTGYEAPKGHRFYEAQDPRSQLAWSHAVEIYELITGTEVHDALLTVQEEQEAAEAESRRQTEPLDPKAQVEAQNDWLKRRLASLQLPESQRGSPVEIEKWLVECGMPAVFVEIDYKQP